MGHDLFRSYLSPVKDVDESDSDSDSDTNEIKGEGEVARARARARAIRPRESGERWQDGAAAGLMH